MTVDKHIRIKLFQAMETRGRVFIVEENDTGAILRISYFSFFLFLRMIWNENTKIIFIYYYLF